MILGANFFSRSQLQSLLLRAYSLQHQTNDPEQQANLYAVCMAAANLDGYLAEIAQTGHPTHKVLDNTNNWTAQWFDNWITVDDFAVGYGQQILFTPERLNFTTTRHRVLLGRNGKVVTSSDQFLLQATVRSYTEECQLDPVLAEECVLSRLFGGLNYPIQQPSSETLDVRDPTADGGALVATHKE